MHGCMPVTCAMFVHPSDTAVTAVNVTDNEEQRALCPFFSYRFVCGVDNTTYDNACLLNRAGVAQASPGACAGFPVPRSAGAATSAVQRSKPSRSGEAPGGHHHAVRAEHCPAGGRRHVCALAASHAVRTHYLCGILLHMSLRARAGCMGNLQLCANPTYNPYRVVQPGGALKAKDMEANQGHSSEGEIPAVRGPDTQPLVGPRSARSPRFGSEVALSAVRRRTSSRSVE